MKAYENLPAFREHSAFYTWLYRVAVNLALSHRRAGGRRRMVSLDAETDASGTQAERLIRRMQDHAMDDPSDGARADEAHALATRALQSLDEDHRAVIVLRDMEGFDYKEIGQMLDIPPGTVKSRLHRARMAVRQALAPILGSSVPEA